MFSPALGSRAYTETTERFPGFQAAMTFRRKERIPFHGRWLDNDEAEYTPAGVVEAHADARDRGNSYCREVL
jgi:hypothetical protein